MLTPEQLAEIEDRWVVSDKWRRLCGESRLFGPDEHHALEGVRHGRQDVRALLAEVKRLSDELDALQEDSAKLNALETAGVDNWGGYEFAMGILNEGEASC